MAACKFIQKDTTKNNLRNAFSLYPTGVSVATTLKHEQVVAITINSLTSVSLAPGLLSWCIDSHSGSASTFQHCKEFAISILTDQQEDIAKYFALKGADKSTFFQPKKHHTAPTIDNCCAYFKCQLYQSLVLGDHIMIVGKIIQYQLINNNPLVFAKGQFQTLNGKTKPR